MIEAIGMIGLDSPCQYCHFAAQDNSYLCPTCLYEHVIRKILAIKPSTAENMQCADLFPDFLLADMDDFLIKDIEELLGCIYAELWTAIALMSSRIFEQVLKNHMKLNMNINVDEEVLGGCIKRLEKQGAPANLIAALTELRDTRNDAMHANKRFSPADSLELSRKVLSLVASVYNYRPKPNTMITFA